MKRLKILLQSNFFYLFLFFFLSIFIFVSCYKNQYKTKYTSDTKEIVGLLVSYLIDGDKLSMVLSTKEKIRAIYYIKSLDEKNILENSLKVGITIQLKGKQNEITGMTIPNTFDYKKYLYNQHIYFNFSVEEIEILKEKTGIFYVLKNKVEDRLKQLGNNAYLRAFILGDKAFIEQDQYENIMKNGISHLFALSGMHLSLLYFFLNKLFFKIKCKKAMIYIILVLYLFITGFSVSFFRAILFLFLLDMNKKFNLGISKIKLLFLTAVFILFLDPFYIYQIGFWYTFVVTFSLLFCSQSINKHQKFLQVVLVSLITFLFSMPISIYVNYEINLFSIINNIILVPFISIFVFPLALLTFLCSFFLPIFQFFLFILENLNVLFVSFSLPILFGKITILEVILYYLVLILAIKLSYKKIYIVLFIFLLFLYNKNLFSNDYYIYFLDVGQGDAAVLLSPQNKEVIMIDIGGKVPFSKKDFQIRNKEYHLADNIILFLKSIRVRKIDTLLLSHGDYDHLGEAIHFVEKMKINQVLFNCNEYNDLEKNLIKILDEKKINYSHCKKDLNFGNHKLYFLNGAAYDNENDSSSVVYTELNHYKFLFMGDAGTKVEENIISKYQLQNIDVLKVGHHGSKTSTSNQFVYAINPKYSVISVGKNNRYGHPNKEVLKNLEKTKIYRTDQSGSVTFKIHNNKLEIKTCLSLKEET